MRIVDIRETAIPLKSKLANSSFDFSEMTTSVVAVITDVMRDGNPVCGFAFNSTGRYACGAQMRDRFIPRILAAEPEALLDDTRRQSRSGKNPRQMMRREKAGGHSERSIAIGTIEVAVWDAVAKIAGKPLHVLLAERYSGGKVPDKVFCYVGGGWYWPGQTIKDLQDEMRRHLDAGYTMVKMKVGGLPLAEDMRRLEAVLEVVGSGDHLAVDANCKFDRDEALAYAQGARAVQTALVRGAVRSARLRAVLPNSPASMRRRWRPAKTSFRRRTWKTWCASAAYAPATTSSRSIRRKPTASGIMPKTLDMLAGHGWPRTSLFPHGGNQMSLAIAAGFGLGGAESYPGVFGDFGGFADDARIENGAITLSDRPGIGFEGQANLYRIMKERRTIYRTERWRDGEAQI